MLRNKQINKKCYQFRSQLITTHTYLSSFDYPANQNTVMITNNNNNKQSPLPIEKKHEKTIQRKKYIRKNPKPPGLLYKAHMTPRQQRIKQMQNKQDANLKLKKELSRHQMRLMQLNEKMCQLKSQYDSKIKELPNNIKKYLLFGNQHVLNPIPLNLIIFKIKFSYSCYNQGNQPYLLSLRPYAMYQWYRSLFEQLNVFNLCPEKIYNPTHNPVIIQGCFRVFKHYLLFLEPTYFDKIFERLNRLKNQTSLEILSVLIETKIDVWQRQILMKTQMEHFPPDNWVVFRTNAGPLAQLLHYGFSSPWKLSSHQTQKKLEAVHQKFNFLDQNMHSDHLLKSQCVCGSQSTLQLGFLKQEYGYYCQNDQCEYFEKIQVEQKQFILTDHPIIFYPQDQCFGTKQYKSILPTVIENNLKYKVQQKFGPQSYSITCKPQTQLPRFCSTDCIQFSKKTQDQIFYNRNNELYLPLKIDISLVQNAGEGIFATQDIKPGCIILQYTGQMILTHQSGPCDSIYSVGWIDTREGHKQLSIRPKLKLNAARFINTNLDKKKLNCIAERGLAKGQMCIIIVTQKHIKKGEQLYYSYGSNFDLKKFQDSNKRLQGLLQQAAIQKNRQVKQQARKVHKYDGDLPLSEISRVYRQFSRQKYVKYRHQFPRLRQSEVVSKLIKQWQSLTSVQKEALYHTYIAQKFIKPAKEKKQKQTDAVKDQKKKDQMQKDEDEDEEDEDEDEDKSRNPSRVINENLPQQRKSTHKVFVSFNSDEIREELRKYVNSSVQIIKYRQKQSKNILTNAQKLSILEQKIDNGFKNEMKIYWQQFITKFSAHYSCDHIKLLLGIPQFQKSYTRKNIEFVNGIHPYHSSAYIQLIGNHTYDDNKRQTVSPNMIQQKNTINNVQPISKTVIEVKFKQISTQQICERIQKQKQLSYVLRRVQKKTFYLALKQRVDRAIGTYNEMETLLRFKSVFQVFKDQRVDYFQSLQALTLGKPFIQQSKRLSQHMVTKQQCILCGRAFIVTKITTHLRQQHSQIYWCQWILSNFLKQSYIFTQTQLKYKAYGLLKFNIIQATSDFKTKKKRLANYLQKKQKFICWEVNQGNFKIIQYYGTKGQIQTSKQIDNKKQKQNENVVSEKEQLPIRQKQQNQRIVSEQKQDEKVGSEKEQIIIREQQQNQRIISEKEQGELNVIQQQNVGMVSENEQKDNFQQKVLEQKQDIVAQQEFQVIGVQRFSAAKTKMINKRENTKRCRRQIRKNQNKVRQQYQKNTLKTQQQMNKQKQRNKLIVELQNSKEMQKLQKLKLIKLNQNLKLRFQQSQQLQSLAIVKQLQEAHIEFKHVNGARCDLQQYCSNWPSGLIFYEVPNHFGLLLKTQTCYVSFDGIKKKWPDQIKIVPSKLWTCQFDSFSCGYNVISWATKIHSLGIQKWIKQVQLLPHINNSPQKHIKVSKSKSKSKRPGLRSQDIINKKILQAEQIYEST